MKISIIIPAYNSAKTVGHVIEACRQLIYPDKEIIVVDDGSTDSTVGIASRYGTQVTIIRQPHMGMSSARNAGWRAATGEICFFTDSDCMPRSDVLALLAPHFKKQNIGAVGGTYDIANPQKPLARLIHEEIFFRHRFMPSYVDFLGSFNCAYRKAALEQAGGFSEGHEMSAGDVNDLPARLLASGWKFTFEVRAAVAHHHETSLYRYLQKQFSYAVWRVRLLKDKNTVRMTGGGIGGMIDLAHPMLGLLLVVALPLLVFHAGRVLYASMFGLYLFLQVPVPVLIMFNRGNPLLLSLIPLTFVRGIVRGLGVAAGYLRYRP